MPRVTMIPAGVECEQHGKFTSCDQAPACGHRGCVAIYVGHCPKCEAERGLRTHGEEP